MVTSTSISSGAGSAAAGAVSVDGPASVVATDASDSVPFSLLHVDT